MRTLLALVFLVVFTPNALALGPDEQAFYLEATGDLMLRPGSWPGGGVGVTYARGMTDTLAIRAAMNGAWLGKPASNGVFTTRLSLGATFALDVLSTIPFLNLALSGTDFRDTHGAGQWLGTRVELGMDHLFSRYEGIGLGFRGDICLLHLAGDTGRAPVQLSLVFRYGRYF